jgi:hypothetical protein
MSIDKIETGADLVREALRGLNRKLNLSNTARDVGLPISTLEDFAENRLAALPPEKLAALVKAIFNGHFEIDAATGLLKSTNKEPARPLCLANYLPPTVPGPLVLNVAGELSIRRPAASEQSKPKTTRPGWLGGFW